jgi:hypothetical protein
MFLTPKQLEQLTGRKYARVQIGVLMARKIPFTLDADGKPVVHHNAVDPAKVQQSVVGAVPNFAALASFRPGRQT